MKIKNPKPAITLTRRSPMLDRLEADDAAIPMFLIDTVSVIAAIATLILLLR